MVFGYLFESFMSYLRKREKKISHNRKTITSYTACQYAVLQILLEPPFFGINTVSVYAFVMNISPSVLGARA